MFTWLQRNNLNMLVVGVLAGIFAVSLVESVQANGGYSLAWASGFWQNFSTEIMGAIVTFMLFELVIARRREQEARIEANSEQLERLIRIMQSIEHVPSTNAVEELRARNWLKDGSLAERDLQDANLVRLHLEQADMQGCNLCNANLQQSDLTNANLEKADLSGANLQKANLTGAKLRGTLLCQADISTTNLVGADMRGASLRQANIGDFSSRQKRFASVKLPDGASWSSDMDMDRFIKPNHPLYQSTLDRINKFRKKMGLKSVD